MILAEFERLFDEMFDKVIRNTLGSCSPDYRPSWNKVKKRIYSKQKRLAFRQKRHGKMLCATR